jgi:hypothetical protein
MRVDEAAAWFKLNVEVLSSECSFSVNEAALRVAGLLLASLSMLPRLS